MDQSWLLRYVDRRLRNAESVRRRLDGGVDLVMREETRRWGKYVSFLPLFWAEYMRAKRNRAVRAG